MGTNDLTPGVKQPGYEDFHLLLWLRISGAIHLLPIYAIIVCHHSIPLWYILHQSIT